MNAETYRDYLRSEEWQMHRRFALKRAVGRCQVCNSARGLDVHHRTYERVGDEALEDLTVLCRACHGLFHGHGRLPEFVPDPEPVVQTAWGVVPEPFVGTENERWRILDALQAGGLRAALLVSETGYDSRLVLGTLHVLRGEGLVTKGPKRRWWITDAGRLSLLDPGAVVGARAGVHGTDRDREAARLG